MLLLVIDPELDQVERRGRKRWKSLCEPLVDMGSIGPDLVERRAAERAWRGPSPS